MALKSILILFSVFIGCVTQAQAKTKFTQGTSKERALEQAMQKYNKAESFSLIIKLLEINASKDDQAFLKTWPHNEKLPRVKLQGDKIFFAELKEPVQFELTKKGLRLTLNNTEIVLDHNESIRQSLKLLQSALGAKQSRFNLFVPPAQAVVPLLVGMGLYSLAGLYVSESCLNDKIKFPNTPQPHNQKKLDCAFNSMYFPITLLGANEERIKRKNALIKTGACLGHLSHDKDFAGPTFTFDLEKNQNDQPIKIFINQQDSKAYEVIKKIDGKTEIRLIDQNKKIGVTPEFLYTVQAICEKGGTELLNHNIKSVVEIQKGLQPSHLAPIPTYDGMTR